MPPSKMPYLSAALQGRKLPQDDLGAGLDAVSKSVLKELLEDNIDTSLIRREIEELKNAHTFLPVTFRHLLLHILHSLPVQIFLIVLIILDVCVVLSAIIIDIFVDSEILYKSQQISEDFLQYLIVINSTGGCAALHSSVVARLTSVSGAHEAIMGVLSESSTAAKASSHRRRRRSSESSEFTVDSPGHKLEEAAHVLHYIAIAILAILVLEVFLKIGAHGKHILQHKIGILDGFVNTASLIIDILITGNTTVGAIGKVVVVLTLVWQVFRILNAIVITSQARAELRIRLLKKAKAMHEERLNTLHKQVIWAKNEIERLCHIASYYGVPRYELKTTVSTAENEVDGARGGIQASLFQLLRFNNAMLRSSSIQQQGDHEEAQNISVSAHYRASLPDLRAAFENDEQAPTKPEQERHFEGSSISDGSAVHLPSITKHISAETAQDSPDREECAEGSSHEVDNILNSEKSFARPRRSWPRADNKRRVPCRSATVLQLLPTVVPPISKNFRSNDESDVRVDGPKLATKGDLLWHSNDSTATATLAIDTEADATKSDDDGTILLQHPVDSSAELAARASGVSSNVLPSTAEVAMTVEPVKVEQIDDSDCSSIRNIFSNGQAPLQC